MRSPWRVPRRSAERRAARDKSRCRAGSQANGDIREARRGPWLVRLSALRLPSSGEAKFVARVEQRETRELTSSFTTVPGFRFAQSGLRINSDAKRHRGSVVAYPPRRKCGGGGPRQRIRPEVAARWQAPPGGWVSRGPARCSEIRYRTKNRSSSNRHSALLVILIKARSIGFLSGLCSGSAMAI
jgi:hypothetical protein